MMKKSRRFLCFFVCLAFFSCCQSGKNLKTFAAKSATDLNNFNEFCDDDFIYIRGGFSRNGAPDFCVLSKSLMNKFHPEFEGNSCQLVFERNDGLKFYSNLEIYFSADKKNDIYIAGLGFWRDSRAKDFVTDDEFWKAMGGKSCQVSLFENSKLIRTFKAVLQKNKASESEDMAKNVKHLSQTEIDKFNIITSKKHDEWVKLREKVRKENMNDFAKDFFKKGVGHNKFHLEDLDFDFGFRKWFFKNSPLKEKLKAFLDGYERFYFRHQALNLCHRSDESTKKAGAENRDIALGFANVDKNEFFKQKAYIYFSPTWFIEKLGLNKNENFDNWTIEIKSSNNSKFRPRFKCVFGPVAEGDFCVVDASVCKKNLNNLLKTHDGSRNFKFKNGETYVVSFFKNGKVADENLVERFKVKAKEASLKDLCIGPLTSPDHSFIHEPKTLILEDKEGILREVPNVKKKTLFEFFEKESSHFLRKFYHPRQFNRKYYKNRLENDGAGEINWTGKLVFDER